MAKHLQNDCPANTTVITYALSIESAAQVTVLADSSKFGHRRLSVISDFRPIQRVITDTNAPLAAVEKLRTRGVEVALA